MADIKKIKVNNTTYDIKDATARSGFSSVFGKVYYNSSSTPPQIEFYSKDATFTNNAPASGQTPVATLDASNFIKDAVVSNVEIKNVTIDNASVSCLVISFNTDAGKNDINIPLTSIFNPSNYYTKTEIDNAGYTTNVGTVTGVKMNGTTNNPTDGVVDLGTVLTSQTKANWNETSSSSAAYIQNKPTNVSAFTNDAGYQTSANVSAALADCYAGYDSTNELIEFTFPTSST